jgi:hypothetical protein
VVTGTVGVVVVVEAVGHDGGGFSRLPWAAPRFEKRRFAVAHFGS